MSSIFTAYRACNLVSSKKFSHLFRSQIRQFTRQTNISNSSFRLCKKKIQKTFILTGLFGSACYGLKSLDQQTLISYLRSILPNIFVHCKEDPSKTNRTKHYEKTIGEKKEQDEKSDEDADKFDWIAFFKLIYKEKFCFLAAICSAFLVAILNIYIPQNLGNLINSIYELLQNGTQNVSFETLYKPSFDLLKVYSLQSIFTFSYIYLLGVMGENIAKEMKVKLFSTIIKQDIAFYDKTRSGELINRLTNDVQEFKSSFKLCISQGLRSITQIIGSCVSLYLISPKLTLITAVLMPLLVGVGSIFGSVLRIYSKQAQQQVAKSTSVADEAINNVRTVRAFAMEDTEIEMFTEELEKARLLNIKLSFGIGVFQGFSNFFINGMVLGVIYAGGYMMLNQEINAGQLMAYLTATQMIQRSFAQFSILFGTALRGLSSGARVFDYMKLVPSIPTDDLGKKIDNLQGRITFENVSFSYPTRNQIKVLSHFNLDVKSGQVVAIVGNSGSGKSTVCALLERFYDLDSGRLTIDGVDIREVSTHWLRSNAIGYISQEPVLFHTSIAENIRYGRPEASNAEVEAAAKLANAHEFISKFPQKYDTVIGERGVTISGGQKQRIAISRALLKDPKILILDEATSALDAKSEKLVQETINEVVKNRTVIIVAHRLSTVKNADLIVVMQDGHIIETGKHDELMKLKGHYYNLFNIQMHSNN